MAASARQQKELQVKARQALATTTDPIERLRAACLARGAQGIKGLSMYVLFIYDRIVYFFRYFVIWFESGRKFNRIPVNICFDISHFYFSLFRVMDDDGNRKLSVEEFKKGVDEYGLNFQKSEIEDLFRKMDIDSSGSIDYEEFLRRLRVCFII
jgi:hypothetical protein